MSNTQRVALLTLLAVASFACRANDWDDDDCRFTAKRNAALDVAGARRIEVIARAGDLSVTGRSGATRVEASGRACASEAKALEYVQIEATRDGDALIVKVLTPDSKMFERTSGSVYASLDLEVTLPDTLPVRVMDSSGDAEVRQIASGDVTDSSGDLRIRDVAGNLKVVDSSGELTIRNVGGDIVLNDSSGDVTVDEVKGGVEVAVDSSGDLIIDRIGRDVHIVQDSSGEIRIADVGGSVKIDSDSSGDVDVRRVKGGFTLGSKGSGEVRQAEVQGAVNIDH
jgi:hypothetical protein